MFVVHFDFARVRQPLQQDVRCLLCVVAADIQCLIVHVVSHRFELTDSIGNKLFETISISLVCEDCMKTDHPEKCTHKLAEMPRWLSSQKMEVVKSLLVSKL